MNKQKLKISKWKNIMKNKQNQKKHKNQIKKKKKCMINYNSNIMK